MKAFQRANGLSGDGQAGTQTQTKLYSANAKYATSPVTTANPDQTRTLSVGMTGNDVYALQERLIELNYLSGVADGVFGTETQNALIAFQNRNGLTADGTAGASTLKKLSGSCKAATCLLYTSSSRTDAGVHAYGLCAHFDSATRVPPEKICFALNTMLPPDIRIRDSMLAPEGFHARFSTCGKVYRYTFCNARHACAIGRQYKAHAPMPMDEELMCKEAQSLCGKHDFAAFAASGSVAKSTVRTIYRAEVRRQGEDVVFTVLGDGFLYNMVRIIAGTLMEVGTGKRCLLYTSRCV